jgi:3-mercaptopyruvate sulfurtransferase SseA
MKLISREELKAKLDRGDDFKLVMVLGEPAFRAAHIPGSLHFSSIQEGLARLSPDDDIVVYCSDVTCMASQTVYWLLESRGYQHVRRYAGGLADWQDASYPLEGDGVP